MLSWWPSCVPPLLVESRARRTSLWHCATAMRALHVIRREVYDLAIIYTVKNRGGVRYPASVSPNDANVRRGSLQGGLAGQEATSASNDCTL